MTSSDSRDVPEGSEQPDPGAGTESPTAGAGDQSPTAGAGDQSPTAGSAATDPGQATEGAGAGGCPRKADAGSYLLGALSPTERADYAAHLETCSECLRELGQLAGLPGLLARTPNGTVPAEEGVRLAWEQPPDLVPAAVAAVRRHRTRQRVLTAASVVVLAGAVLGAGVLFGRSSGPTSTPAVALPVQMRAVSAQPVSATLGFTQRSWGTAINLSCRLDGPPDGAPAVFVLVAVAENGSTQELARWQARPNEDANLATATDLAPDQLRALEVKAADTGSILLRTDQV